MISTRLSVPARPWFRSILRGLRRRCPQCGEGAAFAGYTRVADNCADCGEELFHQRADDAPPYITIMIVGHIVVPGMLILERLFAPDLWLQLALWLPLTLALSLGLLPFVKGAVVGLQWSLRMHGFGGEDEGS